MQTPFEKIREFIADVAIEAFETSIEPLPMWSPPEFESPLETIFWEAWMAFDFCVGVRKSKHAWPIKAQQQIGRYRVDFVIEDKLPNGESYSIIVECDGHEFHEKTKEQAAGDKQRDRYLAGRGYTVLHFTGAELYRDPIGCAGEVHGVICDRVGRKKAS